MKVLVSILLLDLQSLLGILDASYEYSQYGTHTATRKETILRVQSLRRV